MALRILLTGATGAVASSAEFQAAFGAMVVGEDEGTAGQLSPEGRERTVPLMRRQRAASRRVKRLIARLLPHAVLIAFSAAILLPLLWLLPRGAHRQEDGVQRFHRNGGQASIGNFVEIFTGYPFFNYFLNSVTVAFGADRRRSAARRRNRLCLRPLQYRRNDPAPDCAFEPDAASGHSGPAAVHAVPQGLAAQQLARPHRRAP